MDVSSLKRQPMLWIAGLVVIYLWLTIAWFDHELVMLHWLRTPVWIPAISLIALALTACWRFEAWSSLRRALVGPDGRRVVALMLAAVVLRVPFLWGAYGLFGSDSAVQGVMALHILEGRHHPVFLYRWSYIGSLKAHLTAAIAQITGEPVLSFLLAAILMYALFVASLYALARSVLSRSGASIAAGYVVVSSGFLTAWGLHNEGNYLDVLFFGTSSMAILAHWICRREGKLAVFGAGVCVGVAFWIHILATYYALLAVVVLASVSAHEVRSLATAWRHLFRVAVRFVVFGMGFAVGDIPGLLWNSTNDWLSFRWWSQGASEAISTNTGEVTSRFDTLVHQFFDVWWTANAVLAGWWPRDQPPLPELVGAYALMGLIPLMLIGFAWLRVDELRRLVRFELTPSSMLVGFFALVIVVFSASSFGWMSEEPRYLLFLFSVTPIFFAVCVDYLWKRSVFVTVAIVAGLTFVHLHGSAVYWSRARASDQANRAFLTALEQLDVRFAQTDYHISYKYVFLSHGRFVWTSELGPAQTQWYVPFREELAAASRIALVPRSHRFARRLERRLKAKGITFKRQDLLYPVLYDFSERISAHDLR